MPLLVEIEQQETLERNQIRGGLEKLRKDTLHLEKKEYASATVYGSSSVAHLLPTLVELLNKKCICFCCDSNAIFDVFVLNKFKFLNLIYLWKF